jgi:oligoendopeptidase F
MNTIDSSFAQTRWSLADLFPSANSQELENAFAALQEKVLAFEQDVRPQLSEQLPSNEFFAIVRRLEDIARIERQLYSFAELLFSEDTQNQAALTLLGRVDQFVAELANHTLFFSLWWKDLPDEPANRIMAEAGDYRYFLEEMRHFKPHTLSEPEEKIINIKNVTGANAINQLYEMITNRDSNPDLRARAYQELYRVYGNDGPILGQIYQTQVRDWRNEQVMLRKFSSPISARNLVNDIPDEVVDTLLDVCQKNSDVFQQFFRLKARQLGMPRLRRYDIYAPVSHSDKRYTYEQAADKVLDSFSQFDPRLAEMAGRVFRSNHLDSEVRKGKRGGAFCLSVAPEMTPWVLLNYQGRPDDVATMAHELGHAIHSMLASDHNLFTFHSSLPLAETASTFGEMMLVDRLLKEETDQDLRRDLLFHQIDEAYATIQRQAYFALFERQAHEMVNQGASVDEMAQAYLQTLEQQFGDAVELSDEFRWEWVSIPHIYNVPFYVYAYSFGQLLVMSLYQQYKAEGEAFKPRYLKILSTGGAKAPAQILAEAGIDIHQASFWQGGFNVIRDMVRELEK